MSGCAATSAPPRVRRREPSPSALRPCDADARSRGRRCARRAWRRTRRRSASGLSVAPGRRRPTEHAAAPPTRFCISARASRRGKRPPRLAARAGAPLLRAAAASQPPRPHARARAPRARAAPAAAHAHQLPLRLLLRTRRLRGTTARGGRRSCGASSPSARCRAACCFDAASSSSRNLLRSSFASEVAADTHPHADRTKLCSMRPPMQMMPLVGLMRCVARSRRRQNCPERFCPYWPAVG